MDIFTFDKEFTNYLGEALISKYPADELFNGRGGYVYVFKFNNNAYRLFADSDNDELIFQVLAVGYPTKSGDFGYDDAHDYRKFEGDIDRWLSFAKKWIDECETSDPNYTEYIDSCTDIMSSVEGASMKFRFDPNINASKILAADDEQKKMSLEDVLSEKCDDLEDDFDFFLAGIDKMCREDKCQEAIAIIDSLAASISEGISEISDEFADGFVEE